MPWVCLPTSVYPCVFFRCCCIPSYLSLECYFFRVNKVTNEKTVITDITKALLCWLGTGFNGRTGRKGERGDLIPGDLTKGRMGSDGFPGLKGRKGERGDRGIDGRNGIPGRAVSGERII